MPLLNCYILDCNYQENRWNWTVITQENTCTILSLGAWHLWKMWIELYRQILEAQCIFLAHKWILSFKIEGPITWQLVTGRDASWVSSNTQAIIFAQFTAKANLLLGTVRRMWLCGWFESSLGLGSFTDPSAPRKLLKISRMYSFPMLWLRTGLLALTWMASVASLATCLLS